MSDLPKPSVIQISAWQKQWYSIRMPTMSKDEFLKGKLKDWYRHQWHLRNNK
jgi:hypothetical protein